MLLKVKLIERNDWWRGRIELQIIYRGKVIEKHTDSRDWNWIAKAIENAYERGVKDGLGVYSV